MANRTRSPLIDHRAPATSSAGHGPVLNDRFKTTRVSTGFAATTWSSESTPCVGVLIANVDEPEVVIHEVNCPESN
jgi:hypothetical protein